MLGEFKISSGSIQDQFKINPKAIQRYDNRPSGIAKGLPVGKGPARPENRQADRHRTRLP